MNPQEINDFIDHISAVERKQKLRERREFWKRLMRRAVGCVCDFQHGRVRRLGGGVSMKRNIWHYIIAGAFGATISMAGLHVDTWGFWAILIVGNIYAASGAVKGNLHMMDDE